MTSVASITLSDDDASFQILTISNPDPARSQDHLASVRSAADSMHIIVISAMAWYVEAPVRGITLS